MANGKVEISLERYTELIRKETMLDKYLEDKVFNIYAAVKPELIGEGMQPCKK